MRSKEKKFIEILFLKLFVIKFIFLLKIILMLELHSILRYAVLLLIVVAMFNAFSGWFGKKPFTKGDEKIGLFLMIFSHIQLVLGLVLYFTSNMMQAMPDMATAMKDDILRFWKVEHITGMILAIILITLGRGIAKRSKTDAAKHRRSAVYYSLAFLLIVYLIPWELRGWNPF